MTDIIIDMADVAGGTQPGDAVSLFAPVARPSAQAGRVTHGRTWTAELVGGKGTIPGVDPGPLMVKLIPAGGVVSSFQVTLPDQESITLRDLLETEYIYTPPTINAGIQAIWKARDEGLTEVLRASSLVGAVLTEQGEWNDSTEYPVGSVVDHEGKRWYGQLREADYPARENFIIDPKMNQLVQWTKYSGVSTSLGDGHLVVTLGSTRPVTNGILTQLATIPVTAGDAISAGMRVTNPGASSVSLRLALTAGPSPDNATNINGPYVTIPAGGTVRLTTAGVIPAGKSTVKIELQAGIGGAPAGTVLHLAQAIVEKTPQIGDYFDGDSDRATWAGTPNESRSAMVAYSGVLLPEGEPGDHPSWVLLSVSVEGLEDAEAQLAHIDRVAGEVTATAGQVEDTVAVVQGWAQQAENTIDTVTAAQAGAEAAKASAIGAVGETRTIKDEVVAQRNHVDAQVDSIDTAFTESVPPYLTKPTLDAAYASKAQVTAIDQRTAPQKTIFELPVPKMHRAPSLAILRTMPDDELGMQVVGVDGDTLWALGADNSLYKSVGTRQWERMAYLPNGLQARGGVTKCADGSLLIFDNIFTIRRSTDGGKTWSVVHNRRSTGLEPLTTQSIVVQPGTGHVYYGEYVGTGLSLQWPDIVLWRSTDHGATWSVFYTWQRTEVSPTAPGAIRHVHSVQIDPYTSEVYIMTGDGTPATGLWKVQGETCIPVLTNSMLTGNFHDSPRAIGLMFFKDWIAWGSDSTTNPYLFRIPRSALGTDPSKLERGPRLSSTAWGTARASEDGSRWVMFGSDEAFPQHAADRMAHIYAVEDQGSVIYEVGAVPSRTSDGVTTLQPIAKPESTGLDFWFNMRTGAGVHRGAWQARLGYGGQTIPWPAMRETSLIQSQSSGVVQVPGSSSVIFGATRAPVFAKTLAIWEGNAHQTAGDSTGSITVRVMVGGQQVWTNGALSARAAQRAEHGGALALIPVAANAPVEFHVGNSHGNPAAGIGAISFAWVRP